MATTEAQSASATATDKWTIKLYDVRGNCNVDIDTSTAWRPKQSRIALYEGNPPSDPTKWKTYSWWYPGQANPWNTGEPWGPGWSAALIAMDGNSSEGGSYHYVVKTAQTS